MKNIFYCIVCLLILFYCISINSDNVIIGKVDSINCNVDTNFLFIFNSNLNYIVKFHKEGGNNLKFLKSAQTLSVITGIKHHVHANYLIRYNNSQDFSNDTAAWLKWFNENKSNIKMDEIYKNLKRCGL